MCLWNEQSSLTGSNLTEPSRHVFLILRIDHCLDSIEAEPETENLEQVTDRGGALRRTCRGMRTAGSGRGRGWAEMSSQLNETPPAPAGSLACALHHQRQGAGLSHPSVSRSLATGHAKWKYGGRVVLPLGRPSAILWRREQEGSISSPHLQQLDLGGQQ